MALGIRASRRATPQTWPPWAQCLGGLSVTTFQLGCGTAANAVFLKLKITASLSYIYTHRHTTGDRNDCVLVSIQLDLSL